MTYRIAELIADSLIAHDIDRAFGVPGESFLPLLDALHDRGQIDLVTCRHEGSASLAAVADAKLTGRAGVVLASRGPGAFNAALGLHVAEQEAIPLVMLVGQVDRPNLDRDAVQEIDCGRSFGGLLKWAVRLNSAALVPEMMARAFAAAQSGTPGPVAVELPEDLLADSAQGLLVKIHGAVLPEPGTGAIEKASAMLAASQRPILLVGGECRTMAFRQDLIALSEKWNLPVVVAAKMQDQFRNDHALWAGQLGFFTSPAHVKLFERADLIVALGSRLGDLSSLGFAFPRQAAPRQPLVQVYPDAGAIGTRFQTDLAIVSGAHAFLRAMLAVPAVAQERISWRQEIAAARSATHGWPRSGVPATDVSAMLSQRLLPSFGRTEWSRRTRATSPHGSTASSAFSRPRGCSVRHAAQWAAAFLPGSRQACGILIARSSRSAETAVS
ncbi:acetolactate synthase-1/2/3 large subunit [Bradyrhizobium sp. Rc3b]|uniref:thiamine pyrophosphate-binding protein n=1 Tax=Bradyrhizobium sp. Rc3b TaxID=1855322 RepID=UPI0008EE9738|nr:thiamine pyrophosphate-binding protein [Bradyrhizobium sp. Rc3b]SFN83364.1 acetolactate synthase-1/2/3 large subunit [Bradyrhizobium sp. Rc3b]